MANQKTSPWTKEAPTDQGFYWHWSGSIADVPIPLSVLKSGTNKKCFVATGQFGLKRAVFCEDYGGWWAPAEHPETPDLDMTGMEVKPSPIQVSGNFIIATRKPEPEEDLFDEYEDMYYESSAGEGKAKYWTSNVSDAYVFSELNEAIKLYNEMNTSRSPLEILSV